MDLRVLVRTKGASWNRWRQRRTNNQPTLLASALSYANRAITASCLPDFGSLVAISSTRQHGSLYTRSSCCRKYSHICTFPHLLTTLSPLLSISSLRTHTRRSEHSAADWILQARDNRSERRRHDIQRSALHLSAVSPDQILTDRSLMTCNHRICLRPGRRCSSQQYCRL